MLHRCELWEDRESYVVGKEYLAVLNSEHWAGKRNYFHDISVSVIEYHSTEGAAFGGNRRGRKRQFRVELILAQ